MEQQLPLYYPSTWCHFYINILLFSTSLQVNISGSNKIAGVFIKNIIPASPADKCNVLQVGDRILAVDDTNLKDASHQYAVSVIKGAGLKIRLVVERFNKWVSQ